MSKKQERLVFLHTAEKVRQRQCIFLEKHAQTILDRASEYIEDALASEDAEITCTSVGTQNLPKAAVETATAIMEEAGFEVTPSPDYDDVLRVGWQEKRAAPQQELPADAKRPKKKQRGF